MPVRDATNVLVVENQWLIADALAKALRDAGFTVTAVAKGASASASLHSQRFEALLTDIDLGGVPDGWEVARLARALNENIAVLYCSGDSAHEWSAKGVPGSAMLAKPVAPTRAAAALASLLETHTVAAGERRGANPLSSR
jgi:DNA-binding response OmpR family regulator